MKNFQGSIVALITPFRNHKLDEQALEKLVEWHIASGTHGIVPAGTTGECPTLSTEEHVRVIELVVKIAAGRIPVMAGAGSNNPDEAVHLSREAQRVGADALLHVAGYYNRPDQKGLYYHFKFIHDNTDLPIFIYNVPGRTIVDVRPETVARLAELPRICGIKDATGDLARPWAERALIARQDFTWLSGEDATQVCYSVAGGSGCISVTANVAPKLVAQVQTHCLNHEYDQARELQDQLTLLHQLMFAEPSPAAAKYGASMLGMCSDEVRLPILKLSTQARHQVKDEMHRLELL